VPATAPAKRAVWKGGGGNSEGAMVSFACEGVDRVRVTLSMRLGAPVPFIGGELGLRGWQRRREMGKKSGRENYAMLDMSIGGAGH